MNVDKANAIPKSAILGTVVDTEDPKEKERSLINDFLKLLHSTNDNINLIDVSSYPRANNVPDAIAKLDDSNNKKTIGVELTSFFSDAKFGEGSPSFQFGLFYVKVVEKTKLLIEEKYSNENIFTASLLFDNGFIEKFKSNYIQASQNSKSDRKNYIQTYLKIAEIISQELFDLFHNCGAIQGNHKTMDINDFPDKYKNLRKSIESITFDYNSAEWQCVNLLSDFIGIDESDIKDIIKGKIKQSKTHKWGSVNEKWLLIVATGENIFEVSTPAPEHIEWDEQHIIDACKESAFDKIYFWDCSFGWIKPIWPEGALFNPGNKT